jgi:hypothetical protein
MSYCNEGDKPTIKYKFSGQNEKTFKSEFAPIDVITKTIPIEGTDNYSNSGFLIRFRSGSCNGLTCQLIVHDYYIQYQAPEGSPRIYYIPCGETKFSSSAWFSINRGEIEPGKLVQVDTSVRCSTSNNQRCSIQILHNNMLLFSDQGNCPVTFTVSCGNCPPGTEEHKTNTYPGYCCLDCQSIASEIRGIANTVRGLNRG